MARLERRQVGIVSDQFYWQSTLNDFRPGASQAANSMRIRHCVECPSCRTRYLLSFSPYRNGSRLVSAAQVAWDDYVLYCSCSRGSSRIRSSEVKRCDVSREAYRRGYGTAKEIVELDPPQQNALALDLSPYLDRPNSTGKRRDVP